MKAKQTDGKSFQDENGVEVRKACLKEAKLSILC